VVKYLALSPHAQEQAQNMFRALWCGLICAGVTVMVSLVTKPKPDAELTGLVYRFDGHPPRRARFDFPPAGFLGSCGWVVSWP